MMFCMQFRYAKPLEAKESVELFEKEVDFVFPDSYKEKISKINGARPEKRFFKTRDGKERALKSFLSVNRNDKESIWTGGEWIEELFLKKHLVPFAIDNFGNYICFDKIGTVVFVCHDPVEYEFVSNNFDDFLSALY